MTDCPDSMDEMFERLSVPPFVRPAMSDWLTAHTAAGAAGAWSEGWRAGFADRAAGRGKTPNPYRLTRAATPAPTTPSADA